MDIAFIPRRILKYFSTDILQQNDLNILISNLLIIIVFFIFGNSLLRFLSFLPHFCLFDRVFGIECPVCGTTRAFCELSKGNLLRAFNFNFSSFFVAIFFISQIPMRMISLVKINLRKKINAISKYSGNLILIILLANWIIKTFIN